MQSIRLFFQTIFIIVGLITPQLGLTYVNYPLTDEPIDVIIPTTNKDLLTLKKCIEGIKTYGKNVRRVIVVSKKRYSYLAEWYNEDLFPFSKEDVAYYLCQKDQDLTQAYLNTPESRVGWYLQQLLKLYASFVIPNLSSNVLVLDSDTIFLRPTAFLNGSNGGLLNVGNEYHEEYFRHADVLTNGFIKRLDPKFSGVTHHMLFQKPILEDLFNFVEEIHGMEFWKAFCYFADYRELSGASEYEIYFNFALSRTRQVEMRKLLWQNIPNLSMIKSYKLNGYHYVSCHSWQRT